ncbi:hypothetical protein QUB16_20775 [Microcoleus sp. D3_18a_C4]
MTLPRLHYVKAVGFSRLAQLYVYECKGKFSSQYSAILIEVILSYVPSHQIIYLKADSPE